MMYKAFRTFSFLTCVACGLLVATASPASALNQLNPCCSFPCQNGGVCVEQKSGGYTCDCSGTGLSGAHCDEGSLWHTFISWLTPGTETVHHLLVNHKWLWDVVSSIDYVRGYVMKLVYLARSRQVDSPPVYNPDHDYVTLEAATNTSYYAMVLPPVPTDCPTQMGVVGPEKLPEVDEVVKKLFVRKKFLPEPMGSSVLLTFFAQHFIHMFFKTDREKGAAFTWGGHGVDASHIYGKNKHVENLLRTFAHGKMKSQIINGEEYPPYQSDVPDVPMMYIPGAPGLKFALGHEFFGLLPGLFVYATIWVREHNRVCDILREEHPGWADERLFQTAKLIVLGETIKIVIEDYVQHLSSYHFRLVFRPDVLFGESFQYQNRIFVEFNHLYRWHPLMPDSFNVSGHVYSLKESLNHADLVLKHGMRDFVDSMSRQISGQMTVNNHSPFTLHVAKETLVHGRQLRFRSFNEYRKRFNLKPYRNFLELTGNANLAVILRELYKDVDAVEFYVGLLAERRRERAMFGSTIVEMGGPFSVKGLLSSPICSPKFWRPSTFGGQVGWDLVNTATLKKLFCDNIRGECPLVSLRVPDFQEPDPMEETKQDL